MRALYDSADEEMRRRWDRSLPLADAVLDRWERAERLGFAEGASIYNSALVYGDVSVGERSWIGPNVLLDGSGGRLVIGAWCSISAGVQIYTHDTVAWSTSLGQSEHAKAPTTIGSGAYIGPNSVIAKGVTIGDRAVIGAMSFVNADIPAGKKAWGTPAKVVGDSV